MRNRIQIALWAALFFIFISAKDHAPQEIKWYALRDVKFEDKWSKEYESYIRYPVFSPALKALNNQEVFIKGYVIPLDTKGGLYALSANPYAACYFCGGSGPETIMSLVFKTLPKTRYKTDDIVTFKGKFNLNSVDVESFIYSLMEAEPYQP
jgi:hypothetical protein